MKRDRCYVIMTKDGPMRVRAVRVRAAKKPDERTEQALRNLFEAAHRLLSRRMTEDCGGNHAK